LLRSHGKDFGIRENSAACDVIGVCVGQQDRFHRFASQAHLLQRIQNGLRLAIISTVNQDHLAGRGRNDPNGYHAVLHLLRTSGKRLTVLEGNCSRERIEDESEARHHGQSDDQQNIANDFHVRTPFAMKKCPARFSWQAE
jgi:hypothetical protein